MAGQIIISNIKTDSDNAFSILANTGAVLFSANLASGITTGIADGTITNAKLAGSITGDKIGATSINANNIVNATITTTQIASNTISNTNIQTGAIENYSRATGLLSGMRNRIINGAMVIAQRGTSAVTTDESFPVDRFQLQIVNANLSLVQSSTAPAGFNYSIAATVTSTTSATVLDRSRLFQNIEGFNVADLDWGTANAKTITISFWARSTVTGTYSGNVTNGGGNRSYIFTYALTANTWTYVTATIAGDTSGTWLKTNGNGLCLNPITFNCGANYQGTAGSWIAGDARGTSGSTYLATTNSGAVFNITGVQLEVGSTATSFDYRPYGTELALCQRYFEKIGFGDSNSRYPTAAATATASSQQMYMAVGFTVAKRAIPTITKGTSTLTNCTDAADGASIQGFRYFITSSASGFYSGQFSTDGITASAEL